MSLGGGGVSCVICDKTAFPAETISFDKSPYHSECFRCMGDKGEGEVCNKQLEASSCSKYDNKLYCKQCFAKGGFSQKQRNVKWTPKEGGGSSGPSKFGGGGNPCFLCAKTVYPAETLSYDKKIYHIDCFKCTTCDLKVGASNASMYEEKVYCKKCFTTGGFTQKQRNVKWEKKETSGSSGIASKFGGGGVKCKICDKTVYSAETVSFDKVAYHGDCFRCKDCNNKLSPSNANAYEGELYCKKCFTKGGFSQKQRNVKWAKKEGTASTEPSKFGGGGTLCAICDKTVYPAETIAYEKKAYHQECFKCSDCDKKVTTSACAKFEEKIYCTQCFAKGGYVRKQAQTKKADTGEPKEYDERFAQFGGGGDKCTVCAETVFPAEMLSFEKFIFHTQCFKCVHDECPKGGSALNVNDAQYKKTEEGISVYCTKCFGELNLNRA